MQETAQEAVTSAPPHLGAYDFTRLREQIPLYPTSGWQATDIMSAIESHDNGTFSSSELLFHAMRRQPRIYAALSTRSQFLRNFPRSLNMSDNAPQRMRAELLKLQKNYNCVISEADETEIIERTVMLGFCIARHHFTVIDGQITPVLKPWTASNTYWNQIERRFYVMTENGENVPVEGDPWVIFSLGGERPWLNGAIRALAFPFFILTTSYDRWLIFNDTEAGAIKKIVSTAEQREQLDNQKLTRIVAQIRSGDVVTIPAGWDLTFLTSDRRGDAYHTFNDLISRAQDDVAIVLLGNNLTQEIKSGSYAAAQTAKALTFEKAQADPHILTTGFNQATMRLWVQKNFTPAFYGEVSLLHFAPKLEYEVRSPLQKQEESEASGNYAKTIAQLIEKIGLEGLDKAGADWAEILKKCGVPLVSEQNLGGKKQ